ncbi:Hpt domain-containing protein [Vibrio sp. YMD68]|uniref:Hpt domain-containing protein n=1 Tax=Vibrio sp. YMD68 TaxID=3042300 RepID=UPI00249C6FD9|nr:Hpt domain-containing protein [Vibrio sp. YMD68]WGW01311.1 Hpt domain-containing protein [Vibrio sp. YMD68]
MSMEAMKTKKKQLLAIVCLWFLVIITTMSLVRANSDNQASITELGNSLKDLRNSLYFDAQYRMAHVDDTSLKVQLLYALILQLETNDKSRFFQPDTGQLIFTTKRFIELMQQFNDTDVQIIELVDQLKKARESYQGNAAMQSVYFQLSSHIFEAMFSNASASPEIYRSLDYLFVQSQKMATEDGERLQQALAQTSSVLSVYAKGSYLVEKLVNHPVNLVQSEVKRQYDEQMNDYFMMSIAASALAIISLFFMLLQQPVQLINQGVEEKTKEEDLATDDTEQRVSSIAQKQKTVTTQHNEKGDVMSKPLQFGQADSNSSSVQGKSTTHHQDSSTKHQPDQTIDDNEESLVSEKVNIDHMLHSLNGDNESVLLLLDVFVQDHQTNAQDIRETQEADIEHAMRIAHSLKGVAGNLGVLGLKDIATDIETDLKQGTRVSDEKLERLAIALSSAVGSARDYINQHS